MRFLPYEETRFELKDKVSGSFSVSSPWVRTEIQIEPQSTNFQALVAHIEDPHRPQNLSDIFEAIATLPLVYSLPRMDGFGKDEHALSRDFDLSEPRTLSRDIAGVDPALFDEEWMWDLDGALQLASVHQSNGIDPLTLLTIVRRFHYLNCSDNKMQDLYARVRQISNAEQRKQILARIVRQNHYVTERCEASLEPALGLAKSASKDLQDFIKAERGHDRLLARSLTTLGADTGSAAPTQAVINLMSLLKASAEINFSAFCFNIDFFEQPQFKDEDSLAEALLDAGEPEAARPLQQHKTINDKGEHEAIAAHFLSYARPLSSAYAAQAFRLAELASFAIAQIPYELEKGI